MSRRQALRWIGAALVGAAIARFPAAANADSGLALTNPDAPTQHGSMLRGLLLPAKNRLLEGRFGLMFKGLPAFEPPDDLLSGLAASMQEGASREVTDTSTIPAGFVFLGQFIDHDLTFDTTPISEQQEDPLARENFRSARFDLDSVYGPATSPEFYDPDDRAKLRVVANLSDPSVPDDLPRTDAGRAIIGDPRDDENLVTIQLHLALRKFHNALVDHVRARQDLSDVDEVFTEARRLCRWHYQWVVVHDFLLRMVGQGVLDEVLQERADRPAQVRLRFFNPENPKNPMMPLEFAVAAYRFGHSMLRPWYVINKEGGGADLFGAVANDFNLNGARPIPTRLEIDWRHFFDLRALGAASPPTNGSRRLDGDLSVPLFNLPSSIVPTTDTRKSLAERNLLRGKRVGLPSGQRVAKRMGVEVLSNQELGLGGEPEWEEQAPLWYYILKEAELRHKGERLGAVGGRIVAEVALGLLRFDKTSYLRQDPPFRPEPPIAREAGLFGIGDLLKFAGVFTNNP
jgi:heme peroxidase